jgi:tellurite resistance protein TerC
MTIPAWLWAVAAGGLVAAVVAEIVMTGRPGHGSFTVRRAIRWAAAYVSLAVVFGLAVGATAGWPVAGQFYGGYLTEYSLSLDNLFIFYVIMSWFAVPAARQHRVLFLGIGLALVLRSVLIVAGAAAVHRFGWLFYPMGAFLLWTAAGLISGRSASPQENQHTRLRSWLRRRIRQADDDDGNRLIVWRSGRPVATPLFLLAAAIGLADVAFAFDSIPAVFGITTSAALIVACNVFALMGLRQLYVLLVRTLDRIVYLHAGLAVICAFIGVKLLLEALDSSGVAWAVNIPAWISVTVVAAVLLITVVAGLVARRPGAHDHGRRLPRQAAGERRFAIVDTDGNGVWQREDGEELTRKLCETFGYAPDSALGRAVANGQRALFDVMLAHMDANGDQEISRDEFAAGLGRAIEDRPGFDTAVRAAAVALIQMADRDGNGVLDPAEYRQLAAVCGTSTDEAERAFSRLDVDRNGFVDAAELSLGIGQFFAA